MNGFCQNLTEAPKMFHDDAILDWKDVHRYLLWYKKTTSSLRKEMARTIHTFSIEMQFVIAYYEKELKNRLSWQLMDYFTIQNCEINENLSVFSEMKLTEHGRRVKKTPDYCAKSRFIYEKRIIQQILQSGLEFKNIANEFRYNFFEFLITTEQTLLAVQFSNDKFPLCYDLMKKKEIYDFNFYQKNLHSYKKHICTDESLLTEYDKNIIMKYQKRIYICLLSKIEKDDFSFFPLRSSNKLKEILVYKKDIEAFYLLVNRHLSIYGHGKQADRPIEEFLLEQLFDLWERKKIHNHANLYFKISEMAFYNFVNKNKLIPKQMFTFFSFFKVLVPWNILNNIDPVLVDEMGILLKRMANIQKPFGTFEKINIKPDQINDLLEKRGPSCSTKDILDKEQSPCMDTDTFNQIMQPCSTEKLYPGILQYQCVYTNMKETFLPFNYTFPIALQIYEKLKIDSSEFRKVVAFGKGVNIEAYRKINERLGYKLRDTHPDGDKIDKLNEEIPYDIFNTNKPLEYLSNEYYFRFLNLNIKYKTIFESKKALGRNIIIEQSLKYHPPQILRKLVHFSVCLGVSIFKYLKYNNFDYLKLLSGDFLETTASLLPYFDRNLFFLLRKERIELEDLKPYLIYDLDFTFYTPQELIGLFDINWSDEKCRQCRNRTTNDKNTIQIDADKFQDGQNTILSHNHKSHENQNMRKNIFEKLDESENNADKSFGNKIIFKKKNENENTRQKKEMMDQNTRDIKESSNTKIDVNLKRVLLQFTSEEDHSVVIKYLIYKNVPSIDEYVVLNDTLYEYLRNRMISDQCYILHQDLNNDSLINSNTLLFYQVLASNPMFAFKFLSELDGKNCSLKEAVLGYALKTHLQTLFDEINRGSLNEQTLLTEANIDHVEHSKTEHSSNDSGKYHSVLGLSLQKYKNLLLQNENKEANLYYKAVFKDPWHLLFPDDNYSTDGSIFRSDLFYTLSCIRPRDIHPYIPSIAILDHRSLNIHLRDKYFTFVHRNEIDEFFDMFSRQFDVESDELKQLGLQRALLYLMHVHNIKVSQLISLYYHQNSQISNMARSRLNSLEIRNPDVLKLKTKILNYLLNKPNATPTFINDITFYYNLDTKSIELLIELIKKSKEPRLIECLIRISKHSHLNFYLSDLLDVTENPVSVVDELRYVINKEVVCSWIKKKLLKTYSGMTAVYLHCDIVEIMYIMKIPFEDVYSFNVQQPSHLETPSINTNQLNVTLQSGNASDFLIPFYITSSIVHFYKLSHNEKFHTLFYFSTYAAKLPSFHKYIRVVLPIIFAEFLCDNSISFLSLKNIIEYTLQFDQTIILFIWKHIGTLTVTNKLETIKLFEMIFVEKNILTKDASNYIIPLSMLCILVFRNDNNSNVQKEFSKFSGTIHGTKIVKKYFKEIFSILNKAIAFELTMEPSDQSNVKDFSVISTAHTMSEKYASAITNQQKDDLLDKNVKYHPTTSTTPTISEKYASTITKLQFNRLIDDLIEKYPKELECHINRDTANQIFLRCLKNRFMINKVMEIIIAEKRKIITVLDENIIGNYLLENNVEHSVYEIFSDDLISKKILSGEIELFKYLRDKKMLYVEILNKLLKIKKDITKPIVYSTDMENHMEKSQIFQLYQELKPELLKKINSEKNIEQMLLKIGYIPLIIDFLEYMPKIDDHGYLRSLIEYTLAQKLDEFMTERILHLIIQKIDISLVKLIHTVPLDRLIDKLPTADINIVRNRLHEVKEYEKCIIWLLKANLTFEFRDIVQGCLQKLLPQLESTNKTQKILIAYTKALISNK